MYGFDLLVFHAIYSLQGRNQFIDWTIIFVGEYLPLLIGATIVWWAYKDFRDGKHKKALAYIRALVIAIVARVGVAELIKFFWHRPRPFIALNIPHLLTAYAYSFPSGNSIFLFAIATGVFFINKRYGYWVYTFSLLVGVGRVAAGVHYPSDILGGAILGIASGYAVRAIWKIRIIDNRSSSGTEVCLLDKIIKNQDD